MTARFGWLACVLTLSGVACDEKPAPPPQASATASASASPLPSHRLPPRALRKAPTCRALAVQGKVLAGDKPMAVGTAVDGKTWLELDKGSSVSFRHSVSAREVTLKGPARALPCVDGDEDFLLSRGGLEASAGPGARPGAQVTVYLPFGTVSYGDARMFVQASEGRAEIKVTKGEAWATPVGGARRTGSEVVRPPKGTALLAGTPKAEALAEECEKAAAAAESLAREVLHPTAGPDAGGTLGERAAAHMKARRAARGACWCARAAAGLVPDAARRDLEQRLQRADQRWRAIGRGASASPKPSAN